MQEVLAALGCNTEMNWVLRVLVGLCCVVVAQFMARWGRRHLRAKEVFALAARKRACRDAKEHPVLREAMRVAKRDAALERRVLMAGACELRRMMARKEVTCEEVVLAFCRRTLEVGTWRNEGLNCVTEENYDDALCAARKIDREATPEDWADEARLPLLGVPISVKDMFIQKGFDATMGIAARCFYWGEEGAPEDGLLIKLIIDAGGVPFVRTTTPQAMMLPECESNVWGVSRNPCSLARTPGGSSGGESGLIAARCSPLGLGTDIAGSIRGPCHSCGLCGLKPTPERTSLEGTVKPHKGDHGGVPSIRPTAGPMAHRVEDLAAMLRAWWRPAMWEGDPSCPHMPFDEKAFMGRGGGGSGDGGGGDSKGRRLRFALLRTDGFMDACATGERAVQEAAAALRGAGHEVREVSLPDFIDGWKATRLFFAIICADGSGKSFEEGLEGEPFYKSYKKIRRLAGIPNFLRPLLSGLCTLAGEWRSQTVLRATRCSGISAYDYWEVYADLEAYRKAFTDFLRSCSCELLLLPALPLPAMPHGVCQDLMVAYSYNYMMNLLGWPAGVVPATHVRKSEESYPREHLPKRQHDSIAKGAERVMKGSAGLPFGVQVVGLPYSDELVLYAMRELEAARPPFDTLEPLDTFAA
eukprot:NODE_2006_length_2313_cov_12.816102.p1 GENE.NODE_2006_length_2313_cov_12.816102~~NODE_2006_length_2313_cov_12.816102.p1  ORF type:complete len:642 (+),score=183.71 NODE_2006_length_2313_cov_12.816102:59-1984(+)